MRVAHTTTPPIEATPAPALSLDERLALTGLAMDAKLAEAAVRFGVDTAHIPDEVLPPITQPVEFPVPPCPYTTPVARLLHEAHARLEAGWCRTVLRDEDGAVCLLGSLRAAGAAGADYDVAADILFEVIRRIDPGADSVSGWNDMQATARGPLIVLERAARLASDRGL